MSIKMSVNSTSGIYFIMLIPCLNLESIIADNQYIEEYKRHQDVITRLQTNGTMSYLQNQRQNRYVGVGSFRQAIQGPNQVKPQGIVPSRRNQPTRESSESVIFISHRISTLRYCQLIQVAFFSILFYCNKPTFICDKTVLQYTNCFATTSSLHLTKDLFMARNIFNDNVLTNLTYF